MSILEDAIYVRQSVDRLDSISTESQVEFCKKEVTDGRVRIYTDKGYSGKNTDRPAFLQMMQDVEAGQIRRVIVYRLDRISRSVLDFANMINVFQKYNVEFVSTMEKFGTDSPTGRALVMLLMTFAQLERETIQRRVIDAYSSRSKHGFYMGGRIPYGFKSLKEISINGVRTKMYEPCEEEANVIKLIFSLYSEPQTSLGDVMRYLAEHGIKKRNGQPFSRGSVRDIIVSTAYVKADYHLYDFFRAQGTNIVNPIDDFIGINGAYLYSGDNPKRKTLSLEKHTLVLAPHEGFIDSKVWVKCRSKCLGNSRSAKPTKATATWLAGKIKCGHCGYALISKISQRKTKPDERYFVCNYRLNAGDCSFGSIQANLVHEIVFEEMTKKLEEFSTLSAQQNECNNLQIIKLKTRIDSIDKEISSLLSKISAANDTVMQYINNRIFELDTEKRELGIQITNLNSNRTNNVDEISDYLKHWDEMTNPDRVTVVDCLIDRVSVTEDKIEIRWKI